MNKNTQEQEEREEDEGEKGTTLQSCNLI